VPEPQAPLLVLASASPRRSALLSQIGVRHRVVAPQLDESRHAQESIERCVQRLAQQKALQVSARLEDAEVPVLGADTAVVLDGAMQGKPRDREHALDMLARLSGREHSVLSAVALARHGSVSCRLSRSVVRLRTLSSAECAAYWASGEPADKAGAYAIQGLGAVLVESLSGSYSGVMGLPLLETAALLAAAAVPVWQA
jgi:septum formation protein